MWILIQQLPDVSITNGFERTYNLDIAFRISYTYYNQ